MAYRTIEFQWMPKSQKAWETFTRSRLESARLWNDMVRIHARLRRLPSFKFPTKSDWEKWAKGRYPDLHSQSVQQIIGEFVEAVINARRQRKAGHDKARYPWRQPRYRDVIYTNQAVSIRKGIMRVPNGTSGYLYIRIPTGVEFPGKLAEVRVYFGRVLVVCEIPDEQTAPETTIGVDLGVNTLIAATDGHKAVLISGREAKATLQWRNKNLASIQARQAKLVKYSRRWKRLQRRKYKMLNKARNRVRNLIHHATNIIRREFPNAQVIIGEPFNDAAMRCHRMQAQQVSQASNRKIIEQLSYKCRGTQVVNEAYTSQTCPVCGARQKARRVYHCRECGYTVPRDVVGAVNILRIGLAEASELPQTIIHLRPVKVFQKQLSPHISH